MTSNPASTLDASGFVHVFMMFPLRLETRQQAEPVVRIQSYGVYMVLASWLFKLFPLGFRARGMRGRAGNEIGPATREARAGTLYGLELRFTSVAEEAAGGPLESSSRCKSGLFPRPIRYIVMKSP